MGFSNLPNNLGSAGFGNHVVYLDFNLFVHHIMEQGYSSLIGSPMSGECCLGFVLLGHLDLYIA